MRKIIKEIKKIHSISDYKKLCKKVFNKIDYVFNERLVGNIQAYYYLSRQRNKTERENDKIKIIFLCQELSLWGKIEPVFEKMKEYPEIETIVLAIPHHDMTNMDSPEHYTDVNRAYDYFGKRDDSVINARISETEWFDLKELKPDYVFYQRPYDHYLPIPYKSKNVMKYSRICYLPYGYFDSYIFECVINRNFMRYVSIFFADNMDSFSLVKKQFHQNIKSQKSILTGYPILEEVIKRSDQYVKKEKQWNKQIMWTPRWTIDDSLGGSHFFMYKDNFVEYMEENSDDYFVCRPHPLAFENFVKEGLMTLEEVNEYIKKYDKCKNGEIDSSTDYLEKFLNTDVLITDISGIVIEFFLLGKPIIFCGSYAGMTESYQEVFNTFYVCNSWEEIVSVLNKLALNNDPLKEKRTAVLNKIKNQHRGATNRIIDSLNELKNNEKE